MQCEWFLLLGAHTNKRLKKSPTSSVVDGPPIFMKTMAVGPFDPVEFCVTGGLCIEARHLADCPALFGRMSGDAVCRERLLESPATDCRKAMAAAAASVGWWNGHRIFGDCNSGKDQVVESVWTESAD